MRIKNEADIVYDGTDNLEAMQEAKNYNDHLLNIIKKGCQTNVAVVDFGAGIGTFARSMKGIGYEVVCVEPDPDLRSGLKQQGFKTYYQARDLPKNSFKSIYTLNVLEHIEDDQRIMKELFRALQAGGLLIAYVPAHMSLYTSMDRKVGHFRRYGRREMKRKLQLAGFEIEEALYVDSLGVLATLLFRFFGSNDGSINPRSLRFYDRLVFPVSRVLDRLCWGMLGKNLVVFARRP